MPRPEDGPGAADAPGPSGSKAHGERRRSLRAFWLLCGEIAFFQLGFALVTPILPLYGVSYGVSEAAVGWLIGIYGLARFLANIPAASLIQRWGHRATFTFGAALMAVGTLLCAWAPTFSFLVAYRFIAGAGAAITLVTGQSLAAQPPPPLTRTQGLSYYQGFFILGVTLGPLPGGALADWLGLHAPFIVYGLLALAIAGINYWFQRDDPRQGADPSPASDEKSPASQNPTPSPAAGTSGHLLRDTVFLSVSMISFFLFFARTGVVHNLVPLLAEQRLGMSPTQIGLVLTLSGLSSFLSSFATGTLAARLGRRRVIIPAILSGAIGLAGFALARSSFGFQLAALVWGLASGLSGPLTASYASERGRGGDVQTPLALYRTLSDAGYVLGPIVSGTLSAWLGTPWTLLFTAFLIVVNLGVFMAVRTEQGPAGARPAGD